MGPTGPEGSLCKMLYKQNRQPMPWRSYELRACWNWWNLPHSYSRLIVLLQLLWLNQARQPSPRGIFLCSHALHVHKVGSWSKKGHNTRMATNGGWDPCAAMGLEVVFSFGFVLCQRSWGFVRKGDKLARRKSWWHWGQEVALGGEKAVRRAGEYGDEVKSLQPQAKKFV